MAGSVALPDGKLWSVSSWVFYWVIDELAEHLDEPSLAAEVESISDNNLGWLDLNAYSSHDREQLIDLLKAMPDIAREQLPASDEREDVIATLAELADRLRG